jgi:DNA-binding response OmpR family regulator
MTRIVVIEEDLAIQALVCEWLDSAGYGVEVHTLASIPRTPTPSLIVASMINLRGPGAFQLQDLLAGFPGVPVVVLSGQLGHSLSSRSETSMLLGVSALLAKPFSCAELLNAIATALGHGD